VNLSRQCCCDGGGGGTESPDCGLLPTSVTLTWTGDATLTFTACGCTVPDFGWKGCTGSIPLDGFSAVSGLVGAGSKFCFYAGVTDAITWSLFFEGCGEGFDDFSAPGSGTIGMSIGWNPTLLRWVAQVGFLLDRGSAWPCFTVNCPTDQGVTDAAGACIGWGIAWNFLGPTTPNNPLGTYASDGGVTTIVPAGSVFNACSSPNAMGSVVVS
jgi:hypothetical protein